MDTKLQDEETRSEIADATADWHVPSDEAERVSRPPAGHGVLRVVTWMFLICGVAGFVMAPRSFAFVEDHKIVIFGSLILISVCQTVLIYLYRNLSKHVDVGSGYRRLESKVPEEATLPVRVDVVREGCLIGRDEGYMWSSEGTWFYKGLQTAFRFNSEDVLPLEDWPATTKPDPATNKPAKRIPMRTHIGSLELVVAVINPYEDFKKRKQSARFYRELYDWLIERPKGSIESLLPPMRLHPAFKRTNIGRFEGMVGAVVMVLFNSMAIFSMSRAEANGLQTRDLSIFLALVLSVLIGANLRLALLEMRDLSVRKNLMDRERVESR